MCFYGGNRFNPMKKSLGELKNGLNPAKKISKNQVELMFESVFVFMMEMDSTPSKSFTRAKIFKFNNYNLDLQNFCQIFSKYDGNFHNFLNMTGITF